MRHRALKRHRTFKLGLAAATVVAAVLPLALVVAQPAFADYAPNGKDVVGVGSDTLQYMIDFLADGDAYGDGGYNTLGGTGNKYKLVDIDATADANARLAYGVDGGQSAQTTCSPGTGGTAGTGNQTVTNTGIPCVLNPTVVLRAGTQPVQRPNGSGAGFKALEQDMVAGNNTPATEVINFSRASAAQTLGVTLPTGVILDQLTVATDTLPMITSSGANPTNAVPLSAAQLDYIYSANTGSCIKWNDPKIGGTSSDAIIPLLPQVGSGTRSFFLQQIGVTTPGTCDQVSEENDPTAVYDVSSGLGLDPKDAIEPMSQGRLDLYQGVNNVGTSQGIGGYFLDPSCAYLSGASACGSGSVSGGSWVTNSVTPAVADLTGTPGGTLGGSLFDPTRTLYMYFRNSDITSTTAWQPGTSENWLNTLFYDPCEAGQTCSGPGGIYGPSGAPYIQGGGKVLLTDAGVTPLATEVCTEISNGNAAC